MSRFILTLVFIFYGFCCSAHAVEIGDRDWRQLTDTVGITYNQLTSIYDVSTGRLLDEANHKIGDVDFTGWTWATAQDVYAMYSIIVGRTLESYDYYYEENPVWLLDFFKNLFDFTERPEIETGAASGIGRDGASQDRVIAMTVWVGVDDETANNYYGGVDTQGVSRDGGTMKQESEYGVYMYRTITRDSIISPLALMNQ